MELYFVYQFLPLAEFIPIENDNDKEQNRARTKNVNGKVKGKYHVHDDFIETVGDGLLVAFFMEKKEVSGRQDKYRGVAVQHQQDTPIKTSDNSTSNKLWPAW